MEVIALTTGIIPLFHSCLQYFQLFKTAQHASLDIQVLIFQLDCHQEDLVIWGEKHNLFSSAHPEPQLQVSEGTCDRLVTALRLLETLFKDADALHERYGVAVSDDANGQAESGEHTAFPSSAALRRLGWWRHQGTDPQQEARARRSGSRTSANIAPLRVLQRTRWAIHDKGKFESLVATIGDIVGQIEKILPIPDEFRNQTALRDIVSLIEDLARLKLFQEASASIRPAWSNVASGLIFASEASSVRGPNTISRWNEQVEEDRETRPDAPTPAAPRPANNLNQEPKFKIEHSELWSLWFALMPACLTSSMELSCKTVCLELQKDCPAFVDEGHGAKKCGLRLMMEPAVRDSRRKASQRMVEMLKDVSQLSMEMQETMAPELDQITLSPVVHFYCAPCRCAVRTAMLLCKPSMNKWETWGAVRIDDRIPNTCCDAGGVKQQLQSFVDTVTASDLKDENFFPEGMEGSDDLKCINKMWIDRRIYALESELYEGEATKDRVKDFGRFLNEIERNPLVHSVVLLEASCGAWILQTPPFRTSPRVAKEFELFHYQCPESPLWGGHPGSPFRQLNTYCGKFVPSKLAFTSSGSGSHGRKRKSEDQGEE